MAGRVVWSDDSMSGSATFTTDSSMKDMAVPSTAVASTHSFRAAHAGTGRVARIVTSSQGREVALGILPLLLLQPPLEAPDPHLPRVECRA
jgi:hypothetical protein